MPKPEQKRQPLRHQDEDRFRDNFDGDPNTPPPATANAYRIAAYTDGIVGASPECSVLKPKFDSGLRYGDSSNPQPGNARFGRGVSGGIPWDGTFHRDLARYNASGDLFWSAYLKPGTVAGMQGGYWLNFASGWSHLHNDDPTQLLTGASQKLFCDVAALSERGYSGTWHLVIEATKFVTLEIVPVWTGTKAGGNDPVGSYARTTGLDPLPTLNVEAHP